MSNSKMRKLKSEARKYTYRKSAGGYGVPAQVVGEELHRLSAEHGHINSQLVVDEARPEDAPLHPAFEWDNAIAGERYRVHQASTLIRAVQVVEPENPEVQQHRAFVLTTVADSPKAVYVQAEEVVSDAAMFADAIARLERKLNEARHSVMELNMLAASAGAEPERMARISLAVTALEAAGAAVAALH